MTGPALDDLLARIIALPPGQRHLVAVAGPPASGKSTLAARLVEGLQAADHAARVVPMDGFHLDNSVLDQRGLLARKGAPESFDAAGFLRLTRVLREQIEVVYPLFDRARDLAIAGAGVVPADCRTVIVEGNYLLFDEDPWRDLYPLWSLAVFLDPPRDVVRGRLLARWQAQGLDAQQAAQRADSNDMVNADRIAGARLFADIIL